MFSNDYDSYNMAPIRLVN